MKKKKNAFLQAPVIIEFIEKSILNSILRNLFLGINNIRPDRNNSTYRKGMVNEDF